MAGTIRLMLACLLVGLSPLAAASPGFPLGMEWMIGRFGECVGAYGGELAYLSSSLLTPRADRLFSVGALLDVLGTGLLTAALIAPTAMLADWVMRRRSDSASGDSDV